MTTPIALKATMLRLIKPLYKYHQHQGATNNCGPTSLAIVANGIWGEARLAGPLVAQELNHPRFRTRPIPHLVVRRLPHCATFPWGLVDYLRYQGISARWAVGGTEEKLHRNLNANRITLVVLGEIWRWQKWRYTGWAHIKILYGYSPEHGYLFIDPASRAEYGLSWQSAAEFRRQWRNLFRIYIEIG